MMYISFNNSELYNLVKKALVESYKLENKKDLNGKSLDELLDIYKKEDVFYISEWFKIDGFATLEKIRNYSFESNDEYKAYVKRRSAILKMDIEDQDIEGLFDSITELLDSIYYYAEEVGVFSDGLGYYSSLLLNDEGTERLQKEKVNNSFFYEKNSESQFEGFSKESLFLTFEGSIAA